MRIGVPCVLALTIWAGCGSDGGDDNSGDASDRDGSVATKDAAMATADAANQAADAAVEDAPEASAPAVDGGLCSMCGDCEETIRVTSAQHLSTPIDYTDLPPTGGNHASCWTSYGVHDIEIPDERWVHNLEHGAVVFLYRCPDGCAADVKRLEAIAASRPFAIVMPYAALPKQFAVVSWGHRLVSACFDEAAFTSFYEENADRAPESVSADGSC